MRNLDLKLLSVSTSHSNHPGNVKNICAWACTQSLFPQSRWDLDSYVIGNSKKWSCFVGRENEKVRWGKNPSSKLWDFLKGRISDHISKCGSINVFLTKPLISCRNIQVQNAMPYVFAHFYSAGS